MKSFRLLLAIAALAFAQEVLNNDSVTKMVKAGLGESLIVSMVQTQPGNYSLTADSLVKLKQQGVPDKVLAAMMSKGSATTAPAPAAESPDTDLPPNIEIGVYYKKAGKWQEMLPEVVNWKTGGVMKNIASAGIVKGDVNGHIDGPRRRNSVASPLEAWIYSPEVVAITEYQPLRLRDNNV